MVRRVCFLAMGGPYTSSATSDRSNAHGWRFCGSQSWVDFATCSCMKRIVPRVAARADRLQPSSSVAAIGRTALLDDLSPIELVIYLRLVAMSVDGTRVTPKNRELYRDERSARNALATLEQRKLIKLGTRGGAREIAVVR